jgi:hypothetical protein
MCPLAKFTGPNFDPEKEFTHPDIWQREAYPGWSRLCFGARDREIPIILELCRQCEGPFGILYVLLVSRLGNDDGRYESPEPISYDELERFLLQFRAFIEQDGRHHLWVRSLDDEAQFIFDNHNMVYAYGDLDRYQQQLESMGFQNGEVKTPAPHSHRYHAEFDADEAKMMAYWPWKKFPLQPDDDP